MDLRKLFDSARELSEHIYPTRRASISRENREEALRHLYDPPFNDLTDVSTFLLGEVKEDARLKSDFIAVLDRTAASQIAVGGTLIAIFGAFNHHLDSKSFLGFIPFALSVALSSLALWPRNDRLPSPEVFNFGPTLRDASHKERIAAALSKAWTDYSFDLQLVTARKSRAILMAWILILFGILFLGVRTLARG